MAPDAWPLLARFPSLSEHLAPTPMCLLPTPVAPLQVAGTDAWIKRDDITASTYGGNKMRKLEFVLPAIRQQGAKRVITLGATGTNAGVATALMCEQAGLECLVHTFPQPDTETVRKNRARMEKAGARFRHHGSLLRAALAWQFSPGRLWRHNYYLPAGCSSPPATLGYVNAALELGKQVAAGQCPAPTRIVVAAGSGATVAGLAAGCALILPQTRVHAVQVAPARLGPIPVCHPDTIRKMIHQAWSTLSKADRSIGEMPDNWDWDESYYGEGYGVSDARVESAIKEARKHSLALESTYTGKAFAAFLDQLDCTPEEPVMFWHTFNSQPEPDAQT